MKCFLKSAFFLLLFLGTIIFWGQDGIFKKSKNSKEVIFVIPQGYKNKQIANLIAKNGVVDNPYFLLMGMFFERFKGNFVKYGEYKIPPETTIIDILEILISGKVLIHYFTVPEGVTVEYVKNRLEAEPTLVGKIKEGSIDEGALMPDTYDFKYGDDRQCLINRMKRGMSEYMGRMWQERTHNLLPSPKEVLILASIIEKETCIVKEMPIIASVFFNRLKKGMKLQSDPTVIYGITMGKKNLNRPLYLKDLREQTPYNTYYINGLPPTPIACPSKQAIKAVLQPAETDYIFFVANETGGHSFAKHYNDHLTNVEVWRNFNSPKPKGKL
jgi:UPF0755 protein